MADEIDIKVKDSISNNVRRKILNIARSSEIAHEKIEALKRSLNFGGLNLGLKNTGISNMAGAIQGLQAQYATLAANITSASIAQDLALDKLVVSEERLIATAKRREVATLAAEKAALQLSAAKEVAFNKEAASEQAMLQASETRREAAATRQETRLNQEIASEEKALAAHRSRIQKEISDSQLKLDAYKKEEKSWQRIAADIQTADERTKLNATRTVEAEERKTRAILKTTEAADRRIEKLKQEQSLTANLSTRNRNRTNELKVSGNRRNLGVDQRETARLAAQEQAAVVAAEVKKRNEYLKTAALRRKLGSDTARIIAINNNRVINSTNRVIVKEQTLVAALDRSSVGYAKMAAAGLGAEAAQNRLAATQTRLAGPTKITALNTTVLSKSQIKAAMSANELAISNNNAAISAIQLKLAELQLERQINKMSLANNKAATSNDKVAKSQDRVNKSFHRSRGAIGRVITQIRNLLAIYGGFLLATNVATGLDTFTSVQNKLRDVTTDAENLAAVERELYRISNDARVPILGVVTAYQRFDKALQATGASQKEVLEFTETFTKALKIGGATAQETESVMIQLGQALTKGNLDGEELRALRENAPIDVMRTLAKVMGINIGQIKEYGKNQLITTDVLRETAKVLREPTLEKYGRQVITLKDSFAILTNNFSLYLKKVNESTPLFKNLATGIVFLSENIDNTVKGLVVLGAAWLAYKAAAIAGSIVTGAYSAALGIYAIATGTAAAGTTLLATAIGLATGGITLAVTAIVAAGTALLLFGDRIVLSQDGVVTFADVTTVAFDKLKKLITVLRVAWAAVFTFEKQQTTMTSFTGFVKDSIVTLAASVEATFNYLWATMEAIIKRVEIAIGKSFNFIAKKLAELISNFKSKFNEIASVTEGTFFEVKGFDDTSSGFAESIDRASAAIKVTEAELDKLNKITLGSEADAAFKKYSLIANVVFAGLQNSVNKFKAEVREVAEDRVKEEKETAAKIKKADEALAEARKKTAFKAAEEITKKETTELAKRLRNIQQFDVAATLQKQVEEARAVNIGFDQTVTTIDAIGQSFQDSKADGREFFAALSQGYVDSLAQAAAYRVEAQKNLTAAAEGLGEGLAGDKGGFGEMLKQLYNSFRNSKNADFSARLASTGSGRASQNLQDSLGDSSQFDAVSAAATEATPQVQMLKQAIDETGAAIAAMPDGTRLANLVPPTATTQLSQLKTSASNVGDSFDKIVEAASGVSEPISAISEAANGLATSVSESSGQASTSLGTITTAATEVSTTLSTKVSQGANSAQSAVSSFASSAVSELNSVRDAANEAADAQARIGSGGGGGGGGGGGFASWFGFSNGGYTGNIGTNKIAGVVHGQEFVMPASQTKANRGILEAMRDGSPLPTANDRPSLATAVNVPSQGDMNVVINNNASGVEVETRMSDGELIVMVEQIANKTVAANTGRQFARDLANPNSDASKAIRNNTTASRSR